MTTVVVVVVVAVVVVVEVVVVSTAAPETIVVINFYKRFYSSIFMKNTFMPSRRRPNKVLIYKIPPNHLDSFRAPLRILPITT